MDKCLNFENNGISHKNVTLESTLIFAQCAPTLNTISKVKNCTCEKFLCFFRNKAKLLSHVLNPHKKAKTLPPQKVKEDRKEETIINKKESKRRVKKTHR